MFCLWDIYTAVWHILRYFINEEDLWNILEQQNIFFRKIVPSIFSGIALLRCCLWGNTVTTEIILNRKYLHIGKLSFNLFINGPSVFRLWDIHKVIRLHIYILSLSLLFVMNPGKKWKKILYILRPDYLVNLGMDRFMNVMRLVVQTCLSTPISLCFK